MLEEEMKRGGGRGRRITPMLERKMEEKEKKGKRKKEKVAQRRKEELRQSRGK